MYIDNLNEIINLRRNEDRRGLSRDAMALCARVELPESTAIARAQNEILFDYYLVRL